MVLEEIVGNIKIAGKPILILANKQDNEHAVDEVDIIEYLDIESLVNRQKCPTLVQSCSATENKSKLDPGIKRGYEWLLSNIVRNYPLLNQRVEIESKQQESIERDEMTEKIRRIREQQKLEQNRSNQDMIETYSDYIQKINSTSKVEQEIIDVAVFEEIELSNTTSTSSSPSFPPIYVKSDIGLPERPKSAVEIVKYQLELSRPVVKHSVPVRCNKTVPVNLYADKAGSHSAQERRQNLSKLTRNLKSADDSIFMKNLLKNDVSHMGPSGDCLSPKHLFQTNFIGKLPPLNYKNKIVPWVPQATNGDVVNVIEI